MHHRFLDKCQEFSIEVESECRIGCPKQAVLLLVEKRSDRASLAASRAGIDEELRRLSQAIDGFDDWEGSSSDGAGSGSSDDAGRSNEDEEDAAVEDGSGLTSGRASGGDGGDTDQVDEAATAARQRRRELLGGGKSPRRGVRFRGATESKGSDATDAPSPAEEVDDIFRSVRTVGELPLPTTARWTRVHSRHHPDGAHTSARVVSVRRSSRREQGSLPGFAMSGFLYKLRHNKKQWVKYSYFITAERDKLLYRKVGTTLPPREVLLIPGLRVELAQDDPEAQQFVKRRAEEFRSSGLVLTYEVATSLSVGAVVHHTCWRVVLPVCTPSHSRLLVCPHPSPPHPTSTPPTVWLHRETTHQPVSTARMSLDDEPLPAPSDRPSDRTPDEIVEAPTAANMNFRRTLNVMFRRRQVDALRSRERSRSSGATTQCVFFWWRCGRGVCDDVSRAVVAT